MSDRKAQTATEYMIILAVVIIIALIVVGVLGGIPGIGGGARSRGSSAYWQTATIGITSYAVTSSGAGADDVTMKIRNNLKDSITVTFINLSTSGSGAPTSAVASASRVLGPGETDTVTGAGTVDLCAAAGDSFTANVAIRYTNDETGASYLFTGEGNKLEGTCAT